MQVLTDLELAISKAYISSDGEWFMDGVSASHSCSLRKSCACLLALNALKLSLVLHVCYLVVADSFFFLAPVFHVTDLCGNKVSEERIMGYVQQVGRLLNSPLQTVKTVPFFL